MITEAEADQLAAALVLSTVNAMSRARLAEVVRAEDIPAVVKALEPISLWLRRRALGNDKIAIRQVERELGRQVKMKGKAR